jgi:hypothetical protein
MVESAELKVMAAVEEVTVLPSASWTVTTG